MAYAAGGYLPYDGGDSAHQRSQQNPYRARGFPKPFTGSYETEGSAQVSSSPWLFTQVESQYSKNHPVSFLGRSKTNIGGRFLQSRLEVEKMGSKLALYRAGRPWRKANGTFAASSTFLGDLQAPSGYQTLSYDDAAKKAAPAGFSNVAELNALGTTAIARVSPTNPLVDLSSSAAELLREGLPQVPGKAGNVGGEYLNVMFGYLPLYGDGTDLVRIARDHDALLKQYERDSGRWIRRRYAFPTERETVITVSPNSVPALIGASPSGLVGTGVLTTQITTTTKTWFSGAFTYHLPQTGWRRSVAELDHLYGIRPGIDTVWELTGYSWLVDYFSNVGDVAKNITAFEQDGLVMPYGYVMQEREVRHHETWTGSVYIGGSLTQTSITSIKKYVTKQRQPATPYGFGLELDGLSARQLSILAALGISRL